MGLVFSETDSGLVTAFRAADEVGVTRALKAFDPDLRLLWKVVDQQRVWYVVKFLGSAIEAQWICDWERDGEPLPLSHGLVQRVKDLSLNSRMPLVDVEALNDKMIADAKAEMDAEIEELAAELVARMRGRKSHLLPRGVYRRNTAFKDIS